MRVAQCTQLSVYGGGVAKHVNDLSYAMADRGHDVSLGTYRFEESPTADAPTVRRMLAEDPYLDRIQSAVDIAEYGEADAADGLYAAARDADVVHVHAALSLRPFNRTAVEQAQRADTPTVLTIHTSETSRPDLAARMDWLRDQDVATVAVSDAVADALAAHDVPSTVVPNAVDTDYFTPADRDRSGLLFVGRNEPRKGVETVFRSAIDHDAPYTLVIDEAPDRVAAQDNVTVRSDLRPDQMREQYRSAEALLAPYQAEGMPLTVLESLSTGTPVIATRAPGVTEVVDEGVGAWLDERTPAAVADARAAVRERDWKDACRARAAAYDLDRQADRIEDIYAAAIAGAPAPV